jgi:hypothetical protein
MGAGPPFFVLGYRLVKTYFNRIFPVWSLSFFFLLCLVFALNYVSVFFDISIKKKKSEIKLAPLWKCLDPPLRYMYIVVQCGLSSIVEYGTTMSVIDCVKFSVLVNQCVRPSCSLGSSTYPQKNKAPYNGSFLFYET